MVCNINATGDPNWFNEANMTTSEASHSIMYDLELSGQ